MDPAVALVEAYLHANGYLTLTEYPIVEALGDGGFRAVTDIDIIALRLPGAGRIVPQAGRSGALADPAFHPDPRLVDEGAESRLDLVFAEVKEGRAELNRGSREIPTLVTAIRRVSFVKPKEAERLARSLIDDGRAVTSKGDLQIRLFAFGGRPPREPITHARVVLLRDCVAFLVRAQRELAGAGAAAEIKNPTLSLLSILQRSGALREPPETGADDGSG